MRLLYLLIVQFVTFHLLAQNQLENTDFNNFNVNHGLSQNIVETIYQGKNGFLWIGTQDGLDRFDGENFISYSYKINDSSSLSNNYIKDIVEDVNGALWIGTYGGGLNWFDKKSSFKSFVRDPDDKHSISNNVVYKIFQLSDSIYWIGTKNGLNKFNIHSKKFANQFTDPEGDFPVLHNSVVYSITNAIGKGEIWVGTREGLHRVNVNTFQVDTILKGERGLLDDDIRDLHLDINNTLWVATKLGGLFYKLEGSDQFITLNLRSLDGSNIYARKIYPDGKGGVWLGTFGSGLFYIDSNYSFKHRFKEDNYYDRSLPSDDIVEIFQDESSSYWLGTHGGGISSFNLNQKKFDLYQTQKNDPSALSDDAVNYIYQDSRGEVYVANDAGIDLVVEDDSQLKFRQLIDSDSGLPDDRGWMLFEDSENILWVGLWNFGLSRYNRETGALESYVNIEGDTTSIPTNYVESIAEAPDGRLWIGLLADGGLAVFDKETEDFKRYQHEIGNPNSLSNNRVHKVLIDSRERIWLATDLGLDLYQQETDDFKHFRYSKLDSNSINYNIITTLMEDSKRNIWVGTGGGGLAKMIESENRISFEAYTEADGLVNNNISGITEDHNGNLWITTFQGMSLFNPKNNDFKNYDSSDGLQGEEFIKASIATLDDGRILAGGFKGLNVFTPKNIKESNYQPSVNLVSVEIISDAGKKRFSDFSIDTISLDHNDYLISFEIATTDLTATQDIEYAYLLEGFNKDWVYITARRYFSFTNLPPGEYILKIKSTNADGKWSEKIREIYINVDPPFWATYWFRILLATIALILVIIYIQLRLRLLKRSKEKLQSKISERTLELEIANNSLMKNQAVVLEQKSEISEQNREIARKNEIIQRQNDDLKLSNLQLEEIVDERTKELRDANDDLQIAKHEFDTFFYRAAHDLKGPVSTILGLCYLAMKETDEKASLFYFSKVNETAERMNKILFNLQKINKLKQERVNIEEHNIREIIIAAVKENIPDNAEWEQFINLELKASTYDIHSDQVHLKIILSNLINNSIKFSKMGEKPNMAIEFTINEKKNTYQIVFEDFGLGINPEVRDKIFNMFFVATDFKRGFGLGLYSVRLAVSKLGGVIYLDENKSACFRIELPIPDKKEELVE